MREKRKNSSDGFIDPDRLPCQICGGTEFEWGLPQSYGDLRFATTGFQRVMGTGKAIEARACMNCGNVLFFLRD